MARTYVYGLDDLDRAIAAFEEAAGGANRPDRGNRPAWPTAIAIVQSACVARRIASGPAQEADPASQAIGDYRRAVDLYQQAVGFGDASANVRQMQRRLDELEARLDRMEGRRRRKHRVVSPEGRKANAQAGRDIRPTPQDIRTETACADIRPAAFDPRTVIRMGPDFVLTYSTAAESRGGSAGLRQRGRRRFEFAALVAVTMVWYWPGWGWLYQAKRLRWEPSRRPRFRSVIDLNEARSSEALVPVLSGLFANDTERRFVAAQVYRHPQRSGGGAYRLDRVSAAERPSPLSLRCPVQRALDTLRARSWAHRARSPPATLPFPLLGKDLSAFGQPRAIRATARTVGAQLLLPPPLLNRELPRCSPVSAMARRADGSTDRAPVALLLPASTFSPMVRCCCDPLRERPLFRSGLPRGLRLGRRARRFRPPSLVWLCTLPRIRCRGRSPGSRLPRPVRLVGRCLSCSARFPGRAMPG